MNDPVTLVAIVNSFNRLSLLQQGFPTLITALKTLPQPTAVVVFDAGSSDGSQAWIEQFQAQAAPIPIHLIGPEGDNSFSTGINVACAFAAQTYPQAEWYFLFETDNFLTHSNPLQPAIQLLQAHPQVAAIGYTATKHSGESAGYGSNFPSLAQYLAGDAVAHRLTWDRPRPHWQSWQGITWGTCDIVFTSPMLIRRTAWEATQGLDAETFPFSDCDLDWCWRLQKSGWQVGVISTQGVIHDNQQTLSSWSSQRVLHLHQARQKLIVRHRGNWIRWLSPLLVLRHGLELLVLLLLMPRLRDPKATLLKRWWLFRTAFQGYQALNVSP